VPVVVVVAARVAGDHDVVVEHERVADRRLHAAARCDTRHDDGLDLVAPQHLVGAGADERAVPVLVDHELRAVPIRPQLAEEVGTPGALLHARRPGVPVIALVLRAHGRRKVLLVADHAGVDDSNARITRSPQQVGRPVQHLVDAGVAQEARDLLLGDPAVVMHEVVLQIDEHQSGVRRIDLLLPRSENLDVRHVCEDSALESRALRSP
jgi:hypothetical protein